MNPKVTAGLKRIIRSLIIMGILVYCGAIIFLVMNESSYIFYPARYPEAWQDPSTFGLQFENLKLRLAGGEVVHGWLLPMAERGVTLLFLHGNAGHLAVELDYLAFLVRSNLPLKAVVAIDYPGFGKSAGSPSEQGCYQAARAAYSHITRNLGTPAASCVVFGRSLGAAVALDLAVHESVGAAIMECPFRSVPHMAHEVFPILPGLGRFARQRFDNESKIGGLKVPLLIMHGDLDEVVPVSHGRKLKSLAPQSTHYLEISGGHHNDLYLKAPDAYLQALMTITTAACFSAQGIKAEELLDQSPADQVTPERHKCSRDGIVADVWVETTADLLKIEVEIPRALAEMMKTLQSRYRIPITYEDAPYQHASDLLDVTNLVRNDLALYEPGKAPKVLIPRPLLLKTSVLINSETRELQDLEQVLRMILDQYNADNLPGKFALERDGRYFHIVPKQVRAESGGWIQVDSILKTRITMTKEKRNVYEALNALCSALSSVTERQVGVGAVPLKSFIRRQCDIGAENEIALAVLHQILAGYGSYYSWRLFYDVGQAGYALNISGLE